LEKLEKKQEKIVKLKKTYTERAKEKGDSKSIEKAQTEEDEAIAVLERMHEVQIQRYVEANQPVEIAEIAETLNLPLDTVEECIKVLKLITDENEKVYRDRYSHYKMQWERWELKGLKYCENCKQWIIPTEGSEGAVTALILLGFAFIFFGIFFGLALILGILMIIVEIIYGIIKAGSGDRCPICNSQNWGEPPKE